MQLGTGNNMRNLDICEIFKTLGETLCSFVTAFYAFTGCDYNPVFLEELGSISITADPDNMIKVHKNFLRNWNSNLQAK